MTPPEHTFSVRGELTRDIPHRYRESCGCDRCKRQVPQIHMADLRLLADTCQYSKSRKTREAAGRVHEVLAGMEKTDA